MAEFWAILNDGTVAKQEPDGTEIRASMRRTVIANGTVEWYETCYCSPPLEHERTTIYDRFFTEMEVQPVNSAPPLKGPDFWKYIEDRQVKAL